MMNRFGMSCGKPELPCRSGVTLLAVMAILAWLPMLGCDGDRGASPGESDGAVRSAEIGPPAEGVTRYEVRGRVTRLPVAGEAGGDLWVHHEAIPEFMGSHAMPFPELSAGVSLEGVAVGDAVELTLDVREDPPGYELVRLRELPAETKLELGE